MLELVDPWEPHDFCQCWMICDDDEGLWCILMLSLIRANVTRIRLLGLSMYLNRLVRTATMGRIRVSIVDQRASLQKRDGTDVEFLEICLTLWATV